MRTKLLVLLCVLFSLGMAYLPAQGTQVVIPFERAKDGARVHRSSADVYGSASSGTFKVVYLGFPFETITSQTTRNNVMQRVLNFFGVMPVSTEISDFSLY